MSPKQNLSYLTYYAYSEVPPDTPPADTVLESLKGVPAGRPIEEIKRASDAFGLDFNFMTAVAKIESDLSNFRYFCEDVARSGSSFLYPLF